MGEHSVKRVTEPLHTCCAVTGNEEQLQAVSFVL